MYRFGVSLIVIVIMLFGITTLRGQPAARAQEATPAAGQSARTDVRYVLPFGPDGLKPGLAATTTEDGICGFPSSAVLDRPDAWDCIGAEGQIYDPCFENPFLLPDEPGQVACLESPFTTDVVVLNLTEPLVRQKEVPEAGTGMAQAAGVAISRGICPGPWSWPMGISARCWAGR